MGTSLPNRKPAFLMQNPQPFARLAAKFRLPWDLLNIAETVFYVHWKTAG